MSILQSIRNRTALLVSLVGLALVIFILESLLGSGSSLFGSGDNTVGSIAGDKIDYMEFSRKVDEQIAGIMQSNPNLNVDETVRQQISESVWNQMITDKVIKPQYKKAGVIVSEDELYDIMLVNPHKMVVQQLTDQKTGQIYEGFGRADGNLDVVKLSQWVNQMNPDQERFWQNLEKGIAEMREAEKYINLVKKGLYVTNAEAKESYKAQNKQMNVDFVIKRYSAVSDTAVKISDDDILAYYNENKYRYQNQQTTRKIEYVSYDVVPSDEDLNNIEKDAMRAAEEFKTKTPKEDSVFVTEESEEGNVYFSVFNKKTMIVRDSSIFTAPVGTVYGPYNEGAYIKVYKLTNTKSIADSARVRHILIGLSQTRDNKERSKEQAKKIADSLLTLIKAKTVTFDTLIKTISDDLGSVDKNGDYGWFDENKGFVDPFKYAGLEGVKGNISVVETQFGYHIIEVLDVANSRHSVYTVAQIYKLIAPSSETTKEYFKKASDFAGQNTTAEAFDKAIETQKLNKRLADNITEGARSLPGLDGTKELVKWVYTTKKGEVSPVFEFKDKFIVAKLAGIREKGILPLDEVRDEVAMEARRKKKADMFIKEFESKAAGSKSINDIATKMNLEPEKQENLTFSSYNIMSLGREDALIGTATGLKAGNISKPVMGENGVFMVSVASINEGAAPSDYSNQQKMAEQMLTGRADYEVITALKEKANIIDHKSRFE